MDPWAWFLPALNVLLAAIYILVGRVVLKRRPSGDGRVAGSSFAAWWFLLGALTAASFVSTVVRSTVGWTLSTYLAYTQLLLLIVVAALGALMYYMIYLFSGRRGAWMPIAACYGLYYMAILYYFAYAQPVGLVETSSSTYMTYVHDMEAHWSTAVLGILLVAPPLVAALGYFSLFFRVKERSQRFRIGAVAGAFIFWFGTSLAVGQLTDLGGTAVWRVASAGVAITASWLVYIAFRPPAWMKRRFGVRGFGESS